MNFGITGDAAPNSASSKVAKYSCSARVVGSLISSGFHSRFGTDRCLLALAAIRLAQTANPSALTKRSAIQRCTKLSKRRRRVSLSRKRPYLFFENVE